MIRFSDVTFTYPDAQVPTLEGVDLSIPEGELCLVVGRTGLGKSTLLRCVNGLVPRFSGGHLRGSVTVAGRSTSDFAPRELADVVGVVGQDPTAGFVTDTVEDELAYVMENLGVAPDVMRRRVEDVLDLMGLSHLRQRPLLTLSGGQRQRVAIGSVLTAAPRVLVLDEPTSALDPAAAEEVLAALTRLVHDLAMTVLIAEHRLERVVQYADRVVVIDETGSEPSGERGRRSVVRSGDPAQMMLVAPVSPPVVELGRYLQWDPLALSVRDARRTAAPLRESLSKAVQVASPTTSPTTSPGDGGSGARRSRSSKITERPADTGQEVVATTNKLGVSFGSVVALHDVNVEFRTGEVVALMGRNGAGKSTLLSHLVGLRRPTAGRVEILGREPHRIDPREAMKLVGLVPQDPGLLLYHDTVGAECAAGDGDVGLPPGSTRAVLDKVVFGLDDDKNPRDLSEGQRLGLALAIVLATAPSLVLLDEPTRGLDYEAKGHLVAVLRDLASTGHAVVMATHDVEVVAAVADRVIVLADGEVVADGAAREVVIHSPVFAPQVAKVMAPLPLLTVDEVRSVVDGDVG